MSRLAPTLLSALLLPSLVLPLYPPSAGAPAASLTAAPTSPAPPTTAAQPSPDPLAAAGVWVAGGAGALELAAADGTQLARIAGLDDVQAVAIDGVHEIIWLATDRRLLAYGFDSTQRLAVALPAPQPPPESDATVTRLAADPRDSSVWLARGKHLTHFTSAGAVTLSLTTRQGVHSLALDAFSALLWVGTRASLTALDTASGTPAHAVDLGDAPDLRGLDFDGPAGRLWVAAGNTLRAYDSSGHPLLETRLHAVKAVAGDRAGGAWATSDRGLVKVDSQGTAGRPMDLPDDDGEVLRMVADPAGSWAWVGSGRAVVQVDPAGTVRRRIEIDRPLACRDLAAYADVYPPALTIGAPQPGSFVSSHTPGLELAWTDTGLGVDPATLAATAGTAAGAGGSPLPLQCSARQDGATCTPSTPLPEGEVLLTATVQDFAHNPSPPATVTFTIDTTPPTIVLRQPSTDLLTREPALLVTGTLSEPAALTVNGLPVTVRTDLTFAQALTLHEGANPLLFVATDRAGNAGQLARSVTLDTLPPAPIDTTRVAVASAAGGRVTVSGSAGSAEAGALLTATDNRTGQAAQVTVAADGTFIASLAAQPGDQLTLVATDAAGNRGAPVTLTVPGTAPPPGPPPDPSAIAPPLDPAVATGFAAATRFLYAGPSPVQSGVAPGAIEPRRAAVVRGRVLLPDGTPLPGVEVTVARHPELGTTASRADGMFDLAVNGGGAVTVVYRKAGYPQVERRVEVPWRDYARAGDAVMTPLDAQVTAITSGASTLQVARGSRSRDADGTRQATLLFPAGTRAQMVMPDGTSQPLSTLSVRATEFTVGDRGPDAMPAPLPPTSVYTYAVELSVDEAAAAGAAAVTFSQPVVAYVEDFLGIPVGTPVPAGSYDRGLGAWAPAANGLVLQVLDVQGDLASLDLTGAGGAASAADLAAAGITDAERQQLASLYPAGQSLWRVPVQHFSPWDFNWPVGQLPQPPNLPDPVTDPPVDDPDCIPGSVLECQTQSLGQNLPLAGTPIGLRYRSRRTAASRTVTVPLSGASLPPFLARIDLHIAVAGQFLELHFPAAPNQSYTFVWDGRDAYGRLLHGSTPVSVSVVYAYLPPYGLPAGSSYSFGRTAAGELGGPAARSLYPLFQDRQLVLANHDLRPLGPPGWSLTPHHAYDPVSRTLLLGDGATATLGAPQLGKVAGGRNTWGFAGDGGPAAQALLFNPKGLALDSAGNLYIVDNGNHRIRKVTPAGIISTFAGNGTQGFSGDGGPAAAAQLNRPETVAVDSADNVYVADRWNHRIRKIDAAGIISTVAGNGAIGYNGEGIPAIEASLNLPAGVALDSAGNLFIADTFNCMIRKVTPDGLLTDVAGFGGFCPGSGFPTSVPFLHPEAIAVDAAGSLYVPNPATGEMKKLLSDGRIVVLFGTTLTGPGVAQGSTVTVDREGTLYLAGQGGAIWRIPPDGTAQQLAPGPAGCPLCLPDDPAFPPPFVQGMGVGPSGDLFFSTAYDVRRLGPALDGFLGGGLAIASSDGSRVYDFDSTGRHTATRSALSGVALDTFSYDGAGRLATITDTAGNVTTIERSPQGDPTAIATPFGVRTALAVDGAGDLTGITDPAGGATTFTYAQDLMTTLTDPGGGTYRFTYDDAGRLASDLDPAGGGKQLVRSTLPGGSSVEVTTALGRKTSYAVTPLPAGRQLRSTTWPGGLQATRTLDLAGNEQATYPDGTSSATTVTPDPRFGFEAPVVSTQVTLPSGLASTATSTRTLTLADPADPTRLLALTETLSVNGQASVRSFDATQGVHSLTTPAGRQQTTQVDPQGRPLRLAVGDLAPTVFGYDARGRLATLTQGSGTDARVTTLAYDARGRVAAVTDPLQRTVGFTYDAAGRPTAQTLPDGETVRLTLDPNGNALSFTPSGRPAHSFTYNAVNLPTAYQPPDLGAGPSATSYAYDLDRALVRVARPGGQAVTATYDAAGRLETIVDGRGTTRWTYDPATGLLAAVADPAGGQLSERHDGPLVTRTTWTGAVAGTVDRTYNADFRLASLAVNGGGAAAYQYDADGLVTRAGDLALQNDPKNGLLSGTTLGTVATSASYNAFGEAIGVTAAAGSTPLYSVQYTRDKMGRITQKVETVEGTAATFDYTYDVRGRLTTVRKDGALLSTYTYDRTGNRLSWTGSGASRAATYDNQDRLLQYGDLAYSYQPGGELASKAQNGHTVTYSYDAFGNLLGVTTADGIAISYLLDGRNRRIGKKVNGTLVSGFLYCDALAPVAQLDGAGNVVSLFVYATRPNVPDYMITGGKTYRILTDQLGSPRLVVDTATGTVAQRMDYDEFGQVVLDTSPGFQPFGFAGGLSDPQTGLVRFGYRDYDPQTGRWTAKDPLGLAGGEATLYGYAGADPVNNIDPTGLRQGCEWYKPLADWLCEQIKELADNLEIDPNFLLALAAHESQWNDHANGNPGDVPQHAKDLNNPFGVTHGGGNNLKYSSLDDAFDFWFETYGAQVQGAKKFKDFADGLKRARYNTVNKDYYKQLEALYKRAKWFSEHCKDKCSGEK
jgi:RHS repeat-associated protein